MPSIPVVTPTARYAVHVGENLLPSLRRRLAALTPGRSPRLFVVTSPQIWSLHGPALLSSFSTPHTPPEPLFLPAGEPHKRLRSVERLCEELAHARADRDSVLLAFGGGIIGDITGFLAAIYMRGLSFVQIPTTLLAQVDSSVGGKTGVNLAAGKNLVGSFHHPLAVFADTSTLASLPARELRAGLQESVKAAIIRSPRLARFMETNADAILSATHSGHRAALTRVITESIRIKAEVVADDEREAGLRMILNFGHTLGHAIEASTRYQQLLHGEAVGWGMLAATRLAAARGTLSTSAATRIEQLILRYGPLPGFQASARRLVTLTASDKKNRAGVLSFVLPTAIGSVERVTDVTDAELLSAARSILENAAHAPHPSQTL